MNTTGNSTLTPRRDSPPMCWFKATHCHWLEFVPLRVKAVKGEGKSIQGNSWCRKDEGHSSQNRLPATGTAPWSSGTWRQVYGDKEHIMLTNRTQQCWCGTDEIKLQIYQHIMLTNRTQQCWCGTEEIKLQIHQHIMVTNRTQHIYWNTGPGLSLEETYLLEHRAGFESRGDITIGTQGRVWV